MTGIAIETLFRREPLAIGGALFALVALAWVALFAGAGTGMDPVAMSGWVLPMNSPPGPSGEWTVLYWLIVYFMWAAMMVAMMLPPASPMVLLYARLIRQGEAHGRVQSANASIAAFAAAYLLLWGLFSLFATILQWALEHLGAMSPLMNARVAPLAGGLLIAAGLYQLTPLKSACLEHCRGPAKFIAAHWRPGARGAFRMGLTHGLYCIGCCALLMLLLFVGGVMNLVWIAALTLIVAIEKLAPFGAAVGKAIGALLIVAGLLAIVTS